MKLQALLEAIRPVQIEGNVECDLTGLAYDSRRVTPGMLFVALPGLKQDGHEFVAAAVERGAVAVVCERDVPVPARLAKISVTDARAAMALMAARFYGQPSDHLRIVGVTGTNGKTTVSFLVKHLLGTRTGLLGTVRYEVGDRQIPAQRTTPEALELQQLLSQMIRAGCTGCALEVSSHALEQHRVLGIAFDVGVFTNLTQDHLDYHGTMEEYFAAKQKLFGMLQSDRKSGRAVVNVDDPYGARLAKTFPGDRLLTYGLGADAALRATDLKLAHGETQLTVEHEGLRLPCRLPFIGRHNVYNALAALGAGLSLQMNIKQLVATLETAPPVPGRLEPLRLGQPFEVFVDYAHTDDALGQVLTTLREITAGRLLLTFGCGGSRDAGKRSKMGAVAAQLADLTIITTDNPRSESPASIAAQVEQGYLGQRPDGCIIELDRTRAIDELIRAARPGDTVLIAGKGHETYQEFQNTVVPFDDRLYARDTLEALGHGR